MIDLAIRELPDFLLALDLAEELEVPGMARLRRGLFAEGETIFGRYIAAVRPGMTPQAARDLAGLVLALLIGSHEIGDGVPARSRRRASGSSACCAPSSSPCGRVGALRSGHGRDLTRAAKPNDPALGFGRPGRHSLDEHRSREEPR